MCDYVLLRLAGHHTLPPITTAAACHCCVPLLQGTHLVLVADVLQRDQRLLPLPQPQLLLNVVSCAACLLQQRGLQLVQHHRQFFEERNQAADGQTEAFKESNVIGQADGGNMQAFAGNSPPLVLCCCCKYTC